MSYRIDPVGTPEISTIKIGTGSDYTEIEIDGTIVSRGEATVYDDLFGRVVSKNLDTSVGHWDWLDGWFICDNSANVSNDAQALYILFQLRHGIAPDSPFHVHIHWLQEQDPTTNYPVWKAQYMIKPTGGAIPTTWLDMVKEPDIFAYTHAGAQDQITAFQSIFDEATSEAGTYEVSTRIVIKLWRDGTNALDTYQQYLKVSDFDAHVKFEKAGSRTEFVK